MSKNKVVVVVATQDEAKSQFLEKALKKFITDVVIYFAQDGATARVKAENTPPQILFTDLDLAKLTGEQLINFILKNRAFIETSIVIMGIPPKREIYLDELVTGKVQFLANALDEKELGTVVVKAMGHAKEGEKAGFNVRYVAAGETLIKAGDKADNVYILKQGELRAYRYDEATKAQVELGKIVPGEFVGEMSYISGEVRSADVRAFVNSELIEIPIGTLDKLLYQRPAWSKTLLSTLSKRLKNANEKK